MVRYGRFEWDLDKAEANHKKHRLRFEHAVEAFLDAKRIVAVDELHSKKEPRYFCIGKVGRKIATVRFTLRQGHIRLIGAGFRRKGGKLYEQENKTG